MKKFKAIDPKRITIFELGNAYCKDQISLIIPFKNLEHFHRCVSELIEKNKKPQPPGNTGYYLTYRGTLIDKSFVSITDKGVDVNKYYTFRKKRKKDCK
jgi:hypothetical protein